MNIEFTNVGILPTESLKLQNCLYQLIYNIDSCKSSFGFHRKTSLSIEWILYIISLVELTYHSYIFLNETQIQENQNIKEKIL